MSVFKCKMCGGSLEIIEGSTVAECEYCGTKQTVPTLDNEKKMTLFSRANRLRFACEFDKSYGVYESIVAEFPEEAEAYWGLILCKYGIEYVDDPKTGKKIPTCHRSSFDGVFDDPNFELVMEYSDAMSRAVYREEAKEIERLRTRILEVSSKEEPYDIFICYKETDAMGERTLDSVIAQDVYDALTEKGYKVFFSRITLEDKLGQEYEPYIFAALNSAKVMLAFGTDYEYYNAVWVKNEWSRYLSLIEKGEKKVLIPCYKGIDAYDMPSEFKRLQAQDMGKVGAIQDLLRGIEKIIGKENGGNNIAQVSVPANGPNTDTLLKRAFMALEDREWEKAKEFCEQALNIDPENAQAYLGKLMADLKVKTQDELKEFDRSFESNKNYQKAIKFGNNDFNATLKGYISIIKERNDNKRIARTYDDAVDAMNDADDESSYKAVAEMFKSIIGFKDSGSLAEECLAQAEACKKEEQKARFSATSIINAILAGPNAEVKSTEDEMAEVREKEMRLADLLSNFSSINNTIKDKKNELKKLDEKIENLNAQRSKLGLFAGKEKKAIDLEVSGLKNEQERLTSETGELAEQLQGYAKKAQIEKDITKVRDKIKSLEEKLLMEKDGGVVQYSYEQAVDLYKKDLIIKKAVDEKNLKVRFLLAHQYSTVPFGSFNKEKIEWCVLEKRDNLVLLISNKVLDFKPFNTKGNKSCKWDESTIREWLNSTFIKEAFNEDEGSIIVKASVKAHKNPNGYSLIGGDTVDKVFLLSIGEVNNYLRSEKARQCKPTDEATKSKQLIYSFETCRWWLRTGSDTWSVATVSENGSIDNYYGHTNNSFGIRPAMWINLEA